MSPCHLNAGVLTAISIEIWDWQKMERMRKSISLTDVLSLLPYSVMVILVMMSLIPSSSCLTVSELHGKYNEIFHRSGNRNAASHLWASYILDRWLISHKSSAGKPKHRYFDIMLTFLDPQVSALKKFATCLVDFVRSRDHLFERQLGASGAGFRSRRLQTQRRQQREAWACVAGLVSATCKSLSKPTLWRWTPGKAELPLMCLS